MQGDGAARRGVDVAMFASLETWDRVPIHDATGRLERVDKVDRKSGKVIESTEYHYDAKGRLRGKQTYDRRGVFYEEEFTYDDAGALVRTRVFVPEYEDGVPVRLRVMVYDGEGRLVDDTVVPIPKPP